MQVAANRCPAPPAAIFAAGRASPFPAGLVEGAPYPVTCAVTPSPRLPPMTTEAGGAMGFLRIARRQGPARVGYLRPVWRFLVGRLFLCARLGLLLAGSHGVPGEAHDNYEQDASCKKAAFQAKGAAGQ